MLSNGKLTGLVPAVFTPMHEDGSLNLDMISRITDHLISSGASALFACGSSGEGASLTGDERRAVAEAYVKAARGRIPVIIQVGHNSLLEARELAAHAQEVGASAIAALPPSYFKPQSTAGLVACLDQITAGAPELPFYYYHLPAYTGVQPDMPELLRLACDQLPTLAGIKYSAFTIPELLMCQGIANGRFTMLFGVDEMLLSALAVGVRGAVGSTYNFAAPLYLGIIDAYNQGDMRQAQLLQVLAARMVSVVQHYGGLPAIKAMLSFAGLDCGPVRLPLTALNRGQITSLRAEMDGIHGLRDWMAIGERV